MFILFGFRTREQMVSTSSMVCEVCGVQASQALVKRSTKFSLFFIPLFPVRPSAYYLRCAHCATMRPARQPAAAAGR
ncbi:zinc-ribbon domain-containing protein [Paractinoplanes rishiriensis]|uniref:Zinc-ribbon 15 domain-containing protein n=1 Tax=Paractinoplanes rishiriensis TaxID=1050105 RepID=A0A919K597_9ACTN|nr:zinc-ribbon domain-containing protein [Actinoplanes rishiriensis]GIE99839.1 hypothetical protein Ari01nite_73040 [Actinoplanes rishiriensis]